MDLPPFVTLTEDQVDELLYLARTGADDFETFAIGICRELDISLQVLFGVVWDEENGNGLLHYSAANGHLSIMEIICTALADFAPPNPLMLKVVNKQNKAGNTALHWAALNGKFDAVKMLFEHGADLTIKNERGRDAILEALLNDKNEIVEWAIKTGVKDLQIGDGDDGEEEVAGNEDIKMESSRDMLETGDAWDGGLPLADLGPEVVDGIIEALDSGQPPAEDDGAEVVDADPKIADGITQGLDQLKVEDEKED